MTRIALTFLCLWLPAMTVTAGDGIRRCIGSDGGTIYTDRPCATFDAIERAPAREVDADSRSSGESVGPVNSDCARLPDTLLFELRRGIERRDVNLLAAYYHWPGTGRGSARHVMDRLERLVARPAVAVELVYPEVAPVHQNPDAFPPGTPPEDPVGILIQQVEPGEFVPRSEMMLQTVRNAQCWWVRF